MDLRFVFALGVFLYMTSEVVSLTCLACDEENCDKKTEEDCPVGLTYDVCGCCRICAKNINEKCGGPWNMYGDCGKNLKCVRIPNSLTTSYPYEDLVGICKKI